MASIELLNKIDKKNRYFKIFGAFQKILSHGDNTTFNTYLGKVGVDWTLDYGPRKLSIAQIYTHFNNSNVSISFILDNDDLYRATMEFISIY